MPKELLLGNQSPATLLADTVHPSSNVTSC